MCHIAIYHSLHYWRKSDTNGHEIWETVKILETENGLVVAKEKLKGHISTGVMKKCQNNMEALIALTLTMYYISTNFPF